jgi:hypothetical protein
MGTWHSVDTTPKSTKLLKVRETTARTEGVRGLGFGTMNCEVIDAKKMMEGIGPKFVIQSSTRKHDTHGIANGSMRPFHRTVLMRRVSSGSLYIVASVGKQLENGGTVGEITPSIHTDVFVRDVTREPFCGKKAIQKFKQRSFRHKSFAT